MKFIDHKNMNYSKRIIKECQQYIVKSQFRRNKSGIYCFDQKKKDKESKVSSEGINQEYIVLTRKRMIKKNKSAESWPSL